MYLNKYFPSLSSWQMKGFTRFNVFNIPHYQELKKEPAGSLNPMLKFILLPQISTLKEQQCVGTTKQQ
jgi:hypothetical protein